MYLDCFTKLRKHPNGKIVPEHSHSAYELVYYLYGHGYCSFQPQNAANAEKITKEYAANTYFVCAPGTVHDETYLADTASIVARYHFDGADKSAVDLKTQFCTDSDLTVLDLLQKMVFELDNLQYKYETLVNNTLYELLVSIARRDADNEKNIHNVDSSISYIDNHFTNKISIKHLAETSFYSVEHFRKLFKSRTGLTPKEYIMMKKLEKARGDFIATISHEFKTPITAVSGFAELLQEPGLTEEERSQYLQIIAEEAHRLANLANSTLLMSRLESQHSIPEKEPFSLDEQIKRCTILLSSAWEKKRIAFSADLEPVSYVGNEELMRHVWINLLNNAIKFTPEGGEVSVTLQCSPEQIQVRISDTGIGMSPEMMSHIFDQYYQGEPNRTEKGLGLGLSIVHRIVELCGGQIQVDSIPDQGSVFTVLLPRSR